MEEVAENIGSMHKGLIVQVRLFKELGTRFKILKTHTLILYNMYLSKPRMDIWIIKTKGNINTFLYI